MRRTTETKPHSKTHVFIVVSMILLSLTLGGCSSVLDDLTLIENGTATWFGITPGLTTYDETLHIMDTYPHFDSSNKYYPAIEEQNGNILVTYYLGSIYSNVTFWFDESNIVERISLYLHRLDVTDINTIVGIPDYIFTDKSFEHSLDVYKYDSTLLYEKYHVAVWVNLPQPNDGLSINKRSIVYSLSIFKSDESVVEKYRHFNNVNPCLEIDFDDYLYSWNGLGNIFTLYPKIILHDKGCE